jgi:hypothetical protein
MLNRTRILNMALILLGLGIATLPTAAWGQTGVLFVEGDKVGIGVDTPAKTLHVLGTDGNTQLLVQEQSVSEAARTIIDLQNNGVAYFRVADTSPDGSGWTFQAEGPSFRFNKAGTGGAEVMVRSRNDSTPPGLPTLTVDGSIQADNVTFTSSRFAKTGFTQVDALDVLEKVTSLPISEWNFIDEQNGRRHIGPMAEDFNAAFGLNNPSSPISLIDANGITLAGLKGLYEVVQRKQAAIEALQAENQELYRRLEQLEVAVGALVQAD